MTATYDEATGMISMTFAEYTSMVKQIMEMQMHINTVMDRLNTQEED